MVEEGTVGTKRVKGMGRAKMRDRKSIVNIFHSHANQAGVL